MDYLCRVDFYRTRNVDYTHIQIQTCSQKCIRTLTSIETHSKLSVLKCTHIRACAHTSKCGNTRAYLHTQKQVNTYTNTQSRARTKPREECERRRMCEWMRASTWHPLEVEPQVEHPSRFTVYLRHVDKGTEGRFAQVWLQVYLQTLLSSATHQSADTLKSYH